MQIEIAPDANMAMDGRALLRSLQNNSTPHLDLFVREGLQNSLDAAREDHEVELEIRTGMLATKQIARHFDGIAAQLEARFGESAPYLQLRDLGTAGLSGPVRQKDVAGERGNLLKLVYEIAQPQESAGAGGSWGFGKTVYFRLGIGLVLYYSRFWNPAAGRYESRLAAAFVEDPTGDDPLLVAAGLSSTHGRGIAWWGQRDPENLVAESTIPLMDEAEIEAILRDFGIKPYSGDETGTTVLIPFINTQKLLEETKNAPEEGGADVSVMPPWHEYLEDYLNIAVQRWYAPRLNNSTDFGRRALRISVNGQEVQAEPVFRLVRELYHAGLTGEGKFRGHAISVQEIGLNSVFAGGGRRAGRVSFIRLPKSELGVGGTSRKPDPFASAGLVSPGGKNPPLIAYTRQPGMIVSYDISGNWVPHLQLGPDEYVIGIFVPDSSRQLSNPAMPFEEYLRSSEMADHMSWQDWTADGKKRTIIKRIQQKIRSGLREALQESTKQTADIRTDLALGRALAEVIMPPGGFGNWDRGSGGTGTGGGGSGGDGTPGVQPPSMQNPRREKRVSIRPTGAPSWKEGSITVPVRLELGVHDSANVQLRVRTEGSPMAAAAWERDTGHLSPVRILSFTVSRIYAGSELLADKDAAIRKQIDVQELLTSAGTPYGFAVTDRLAARHLTVDGLLSYVADHAEGSLEAEEADR